MKEIPLTSGKFAQVDDDIYDYLMQWKWRTQKSQTGKWYAIRWSYDTHPRVSVKMHRVITNAPDGLEVDHINRDGLCNLRENLRICTRAENQRNRDKLSNNTSGYKGVQYYKRYGKYISQIRVNGVLVHLGYFLDPVEAAKAYDNAAIKHFKEYAVTNFPQEERV